LISFLAVTAGMVVYMAAAVVVAVVLAARSIRL